jgi:hypothetical protein
VVAVKVVGTGATPPEVRRTKDELRPRSASTDTESYVLRRTALLSLFVGLLIVTGCKDNKSATPPASTENTKVKAALEQLSPEDRALAEQQRICPIKQSELGSMGTPIKIMIKDKPVFLCCEHCKDEAMKNPDRTLQAVEESKALIGRR